jgi:hypothetical protein
VEFRDCVVIVSGLRPRRAQPPSRNERLSPYDLAIVWVLRLYIWAITTLLAVFRAIGVALAVGGLNLFFAKLGGMRLRRLHWAITTLLAVFNAIGVAHAVGGLNLFFAKLGGRWWIGCHN